MPTIIVSQSHEKSLETAHTRANKLLGGKKASSKTTGASALTINHPDLKLITGETSISIDSIKELTTYLSRKPYQSDVIIGIIHPGETLTTEAQNALLKTLEEPPAFAHLFITTTHLSHLLPTIRSRCQVETIEGKAITQEVPEVIAELLKQPYSKRLKTIENILRDKSVTSKRVISWVDEWILSVRGENPKLLRSLVLAKIQLQANVTPLHVLDRLFL